MVFSVLRATKHFSRSLTFKGVVFKWGGKVHSALIKGSYKNISSYSYVPDNRSTRAPWLVERVRPCLFEEQRRLAPLSHQDGCHASSLQSLRAAIKRGLTLTLTAWQKLLGE